MKNNNQKGSALVYALIGALGVAALGVVFLQRSQTELRISTKYLADADVDTAFMDITSMLLKPQNCNATFRSLTMPTSTTPVDVPAIRECSGSGTCYTGAGYTTYRPVLNATAMAAIPLADRWKGVHTKFIQAGAGANAESMIRIIKAQINWNKNQLASGTQGGANGASAPAVVELVITFEKKVGGGKVSSGADVMKSSIAIRKMLIPVITHRYTFPNTLLADPGTPILGCPKTPNSTLIYQ